MQNATQMPHLSLALFGEVVALLYQVEEGTWGLVLPVDFPAIAASSPLPSTVLGPASQSHSEFLEATRTCLSLSLPHRPLCAPFAEFVFSPQLVFHLRTGSGCCSSSEDASSISFLLYKYTSGPSAGLHSCFSEVLRINTFI